MRSIPDTLAAVRSGDADVAVVPIENSIEGSVSVTLDTLAFEGDLLVQREVDLPISLNLCVRSGTRLGGGARGFRLDVTELAAHPAAALRDRVWIRQDRVHVAEAAQQVARPGRLD